MTLLAYIDPGLGALAWQTLVAAVIGFVFYLKKTRHWIVSAIRKIFGRGQNAVTFTTPPETSAAKVEAKTEVR